MSVSFERLLDYEQGNLSDCEVIELFKDLISCGLIWNLQGHYQRTAQFLINQGYLN